MKQIIIRVSKLDNAVGYAAKGLKKNYTEVGAIALIETIKTQFNDDFAIASKMYGEKTYSRVCHLLSEIELKTVLTGSGFRLHVEGLGGGL